MKKWVTLLLIWTCLLGLAGCNRSAEIEVDCIEMLHSGSGDTSCETASITDPDTISELVSMYCALKTKSMSRPLADERMQLKFYMGEEQIIDWYISRHEDDGMLVTCSDSFDVGNYIVKGDFDYNRLLAIFNEATE